MPFTLSHAAAALPFRRLKPVWPALVIGTFAPDFEYYLLLSDEDRTGHHMPGLLLLTLPLALLAFFLFEFCIREPVMELLPEGLQRRLQNQPKPERVTGWKHFLSIVGWIMCGIATHLVWDWLTHPNTWIWEHWGWLRQKVAVPFHPPVMMSKLVQYASTLFGLMVLAIWFALWYYRAIPAKKLEGKPFTAARKITIVGTIAAIALTAGIPLAVMRDFERDPALNTIGLIATTVEAVILLLCVEFLLYGVVRTYLLRSRKRSDQILGCT